MQGEAVSLVERTPKDLSQFFEYLSGSIVHKDKYDVLKREAEGKENELKEQQQKLSQLKNDRKKIREKIDNSKEYSKLLKEADQAEQLNQLIRLLEVDSQCYEDLQRLQKCEQAIDEFKKSREDEALKLQGNSLARKKIQGEIRKEQKDLANQKEELMKLRSEITKDMTLKEMTEQSLQAKKIAKDRFESELKRFYENDKQHEEGIAELEEKIQILEAKIRERKENPSEKLSGRDFEEYRELTQKMKIRTHLLSQEQEKLYTDQRIVNQRLEKFEEEVQRRKDVISKLKLELTETEAIMKNKDESINRMKLDKAELDRKFDEVSQRRSEKIRERDGLKALRQERDKLLMDQELITLNHKDESRTKALTMELIKTARGFKGELWKLIKPIQPKFEVALKLALGAAVRYLVVDKSETAQICSNILKNKGIMKDVLVLENIPATNPTSETNLRNNLGGLGMPAFDIIEFDRSIIGLEKALLYLLGGKVICDNLARADSLRKRNVNEVRQTITLDGNILKKGLIIGHGDIEKLKQGRKVC